MHTPQIVSLLRLDRNPEAPALFAVWSTGEDGEILGFGDTAEEALADTRRELTARRETRTRDAARLRLSARYVSPLAFTRSR